MGGGVEATRRLLADTGTAAADVRAVGFSGQMMGAVLLDAAHRPVRPAIIWADHRSGAQCQELLEAVGLEPGYRLTGHRLNPTYSLSKVMWVRDAEPDVFARVAHVCLAKDFVVHRLTDVLVTDPSDASSTNAYDQERGTWSSELLSAARLPDELFPEIVPSTTVAGASPPVPPRPPACGRGLRWSSAAGTVHSRPSVSACWGRTTARTSTSARRRECRSPRTGHCSTPECAR